MIKFLQNAQCASHNTWENMELLFGFYKLSFTSLFNPYEFCLCARVSYDSSAKPEIHLFCLYVRKDS